MAKKKKKKLPDLKADRISQLPAHLIQLILTSLHIKEAGRTSVLSREWRHHWRSITRLVFDDDFRWPMSGEGPRSNVNEVITRVLEALQVHDGPITEFELSMCLLTPSVDIGHLMSHVSNKGVLALSLQFDNNKSSSVQEISPSLFCASQLDSLKLSECKFIVPSWFVGFTRLTVLELDSVWVPNDFFQRFLLKCPLLEDLRVFFTDGPPNLELVGAPRLKVFILRAYDLGNISFKCTPLLYVVSIQVEMYGYYEIDASAVDMVRVFAALPALQHLNLSLECLKILAAGPVPERLPTALYRLEVLVIRKSHDDANDDEDEVDNDDDRLRQLEVLLCLIRSSPNLKKLTFNMNSSDIDPLDHGRDVIQLDSESDGCPDLEAEDSYCQRLSEVSIEEYSGSRVERKLLRFVLANAPRLSRIVIEPEYDMSWGKCLQFLEEVRGYHCASKKVDITCVDRSIVMVFKNRPANS